MNLEDTLKMEGKLKTNRFTFEDLKDQIKQIKKMGPIENLLGMIPGMGKQLKGVTIDDNAFAKVEAIISSMTLKERTNYVILNGSRKMRIAKGSGTTVTDVNKLIKQHLTMKKMLKKMKRGKGMGMPQFKF